MRLSALHLTVQDPARLARFYTDHLGMEARPEGDAIRLGYGGEDADLVLHPGGGAYEHSRDDRYWKIGICLPNVDIAHEQLSAAGIAVSAPRQFLDIGYMCHLSDPEGFVIELLQEDFEPNRPADAGDASLPLGGGAHLGQITLRCGDPGPDIARFEGLGMRQVSIQPVSDFGFELYFLGFTEATPPGDSLRAVEGREWLWHQRFTQIELQHLPGLAPRPVAALAGIEVEGPEGRAMLPG